MTTERLSNRLAKIEAISKPQGYVVWIDDNSYLRFSLPPDVTS